VFSCNKQELVEILYNGEKVMVSQEVADYLEDCRRETQRQMKQIQRRQAAVRCEENFVEELMATPPECFVDELLSRMELERLPGFIAQLPEIQRRRLRGYFYEGLTYRELAAREGVDHKAIVRSVDSALKKLKKYFS